MIAQWICTACTRRRGLYCFRDRVEQISCSYKDPTAVWVNYSPPPVKELAPEQYYSREEILRRKFLKDFLDFLTNEGKK